MKGIASTGAPKTLLGGGVGGWVGGWMEGKAGLNIAYSNQKLLYLPWFADNKDSQNSSMT
jgi:hypothetical protein